MASKHEAIKWAVIGEFSITKRGRLYCMNQGLAIPWADFQNGIYNPRWFGPLKRKFKGFPDTFGFEFVEAIIGVQRKTLPLFCGVEVKTKNDSLSKDQKEKLTMIIHFGGTAYVAKENDSEKGYELIAWEGK